jgi:hypothetical protein
MIDLVVQVIFYTTPDDQLSHGKPGGISVSSSVLLTADFRDWPAVGVDTLVTLACSWLVAQRLVDDDGYLSARIRMALCFAIPLLLAPSLVLIFNEGLGDLFLLLGGVPLHETRSPGYEATTSEIWKQSSFIVFIIPLITVLPGILCRLLIYRVIGSENDADAMV